VQKWLSNALGPDVISPNKSYPNSLTHLTMDNIHGDHLIPFVSSFASFFANNALNKMVGKGLLEPTSKKTYFKAVKGGLAKRSPKHPLLQVGADNTWWIKILNRFNRDAQRAALKDLSQYNQVKSAGLYRDTSTDLHIDEINPMSSPQRHVSREGSR